MYAIELSADVNDQHEIHVKLPDEIALGKVKLIVMYDETQRVTSKTRRQFGQFKNKIKIDESFDDKLPDAFWFGES